jgi:hypothetical protein
MITQILLYGTVGAAVLAVVADSWTTYIGEYKKHIAVEASTGKVMPMWVLILGPVLSLGLPIVAYLSQRYQAGLVPTWALIGASILITYLHGTAAFQNWKINRGLKP